MKVVLYSYNSKHEFIRIMEKVKSVGIIIDEQLSDTDMIADNDHIYIKYQNILYKFNRYDQQFINKVEEAINENPYKHCPGINYEGHLYISNIDDRFTNRKYYTITKYRNHELLNIHKDLIIDDLYLNQLEK